MANKGKTRDMVNKLSAAGDTSIRAEFYRGIAEVLNLARQTAYRAVNFVMVEAYWNVGKLIVEEEQRGKQRADYGSRLIENLSVKLNEDFGKGFSEQSLWNMRLFYLRFPILSALRRELTWTHYKVLLRVENEKARAYYINEASEQNWSVRALERQINSLYYERLLMSRDKAPIVEEMKEKTAFLAMTPQDFIKDPYVLEFLGMPDAAKFRESDIEGAIIEKLREFILELGKGFAFVARQQRISTETSDFYIDLVFYNYILKCFVLIDLKAGKLTHQDIGQMDMYVSLYEDMVKGADDNPIIGIILCTEKDHTVAKYSMLKDSRQLFASKYQLYLPTEDELAREVEREKALLELEIKAAKKVRHEKSSK